MNVKRIVFKFSPNGPCSPDEMYVEKLTITTNTISYDWKLSQPIDKVYDFKAVREELPKEEWDRHRNWFHKTNHPEFYKDFYYIAEQVMAYIRDREEVIYPVDGCSAEVILTLENGLKVSKDIGVDNDIFGECYRFLVRWFPPYEGMQFVSVFV
jgi:hypothetical protein